MMTALEDFLQHPSVSVLGWTLVHFLWQGTATVTLLFGALRLLRRGAANARYALACAALLLMAASPAITFVVLTPPAGSGTPPPWGLLKSSSGFLPPSPPIWLPVLVAAWGFGVLFLSLRLLGGWIQVERLKQRATRPITGPLHDTVKAMARRLRITRPVVLLESAVVQVPTVLGGFRSIILVPASALSGLPTPQLEALLAHELAHIRRWDYLVNLVQTAIETLLFYHPAVWWISRQIRLERENCCDDMAVSLLGDRRTYVRALASLEELRAVTGPLALAGNGGDLLARIRRLLGRPSPQPGGGLVCLAGMVSVTLFLTLAVLHLHASVAGKSGAGDEKRRRQAAKPQEPVASLPATPQNRVAVKAPSRRRISRPVRRPLPRVAVKTVPRPLALRVAEAGPPQPRRAPASSALPPQIAPLAAPLPMTAVPPARVALVGNTAERFTAPLATPSSRVEERQPPRRFWRVFAQHLVDPKEQSPAATEEPEAPVSPYRAPRSTVTTASGQAEADTDSDESPAMDAVDHAFEADAPVEEDRETIRVTERTEVIDSPAPTQADEQPTSVDKAARDFIKDLCHELARLDIDVTITQVQSGGDLRSLSAAVRRSTRLIRKRLDDCREGQIIVWLVVRPETAPSPEAPAEPEFLKPDKTPLQAD